MKNVTMKDIADQLNISTVTVSKALSDKDGVSEELKNKIKKVSEEMGYRYNTLAKSMKEGRSYNVGVIVADRFIRDDGDAFYLKMYQSVVKSLSQADYYGILEIVSTEHEKDFVMPNIIQNNKVDGVIILGQMSYEYVSAINTMGIPLIFLDFYDELLEVDSVVSDSFYCSYILTNYLIAQGHKDIAFVGNILSTSSILDRYLGYYKSLLLNDIPLKDEWVISDRMEDGTTVDIELPVNMPTAFVCNNDALAYLLVNKLKKKGFKIPENISVVGFDNYIFATLSNPKLTTVEFDITLMSNEAVKAIIGKINNSGYRVGRLVINGKLIIRDSVKNLLS